MAQSQHHRMGPFVAGVPRATVAVDRHAIRISRTFGNGGEDPALAAAPEDAFGVTVQLNQLAAQRLWHGNRVVSEGTWERGAIAITDRRDPWRFEPLAPFDRVDVEIPFARLDDGEEDEGRADYIGLTCEPGVLDEVMLGLVRALLPSLDRPDQANALFVDQINLAMMTHLKQAYAGGRVWPSKKGMLARWQERRALDYLTTHLSEAISIADLAAICDLSRSYFIRAFKETLGETPHRWLVNYRIEKAKELLPQDLSIAEVALSCGFADQSHLNKVFTALVGKTPGQFRQNARASTEHP